MIQRRVPAGGRQVTGSGTGPSSIRTTNRQPHRRRPRRRRPRRWPLTATATSPIPPSTPGDMVQQFRPVTASGVVGKPREPWVVAVLTIITLGIYGLYWQYATFKEMKDHSGQGIGGVVGLILAILFGIINIFLLPAEIGNLYRREGQLQPVSAATGFWILLPIVGWFIWVVKCQGSLNRYWVAHGGAHHE